MAALAKRKQKDATVDRRILILDPEKCKPNSAAYVSRRAASNFQVACLATGILETICRQMRQDLHRGARQDSAY